MFIFKEGLRPPVRSAGLALRVLLETPAGAPKRLTHGGRGIYRDRRGPRLGDDRQIRAGNHQVDMNPESPAAALARMGKFDENPAADDAVEEFVQLCGFLGDETIQRGGTIESAIDALHGEIHDKKL